MSLRGVDVSSFQEAPRTWRGEAGAISWAAVKMTELSVRGPYVSPVAAEDWAFLRQRQKGRIAYLFGHPATSPFATVTLFLGELARLGLTDADGIALDHEVGDGRTPPQAAAWAADVAGLLHRETGRLPLLYTFLSFADEGYCAGLGHLPLWIADPSSPPGHPRVPAPWATWAIHQHSITGAIDRDLAVWDTGEEMRHALGKPVRKPTGKYVSDGTKSLHQIAASRNAVASEVLRMTAVEDRRYPADVADWLNKIFAGHASATDPVPDRLVLRVPVA